MKLVAKIDLFLVLILIGASTGYAQPVEYGISLRSLFGNREKLPFWLSANQAGTVDPRSANGLITAHFFRPYNNSRKLAYSIGIDLLGRTSDRSVATLQQFYASVRYGKFHVDAGRKQQIVGLIDTTLSVGSMMWSRNATPVPIIGIGFDYLPVLSLPGKVHLIYAKGFFAHGWLGNDQFVKGAYLHEKYLYLRAFGPPEFPVHAYGGIVHNATWGGRHPVFGKLPQSLNAFWRILRGQTGDRADPNTIERLNALGNTVAMYDFGLEIDAHGWRSRLYRQFYIETGAAMLFRNYNDGLWGFSLRRMKPGHLVDAMLWEHVNTKRQSARPGKPDHKDSYYNHFLYASGWTYHGQALGLPLIYGDDSRPGVVNNILVAHHFALEGMLPREIHYTAYLTYNRNYGARLVCSDAACTSRKDLRFPRKDRYSLYVNMRGALLPVAGLTWTASVALDTGNLYRDRTGIMLGLIWRQAVHR